MFAQQLRRIKKLLPGYEPELEASVSDEDGLSVAEAVAEAVKSTEKTKCVGCQKRNATIFHGTKWAWCRRCHEKCQTRGCKAETRGWDPQGKRRCHHHLRKVKGAYSDGDRQRLKKEAERVGSR